ncbi:MAG: hypothetical protein ACE5JR_05325 [Gemmatimonadota bacterium]
MPYEPPGLREGKPPKAVAEGTRVSVRTVYKWLVLRQVGGYIGNTTPRQRPVALLNNVLVKRH